MYYDSFETFLDSISSDNETCDELKVTILKKSYNFDDIKLHNITTNKEIDIKTLSIPDLIRIHNDIDKFLNKSEGNKWVLLKHTTKANWTIY